MANDLLSIVTAVLRLRLCTAFYRWTTRVMVSDHTHGMDKCVLLFCVCFVLSGTGIERVGHSFEESYWVFINKIRKSGKREALDRIGLSCHMTLLLILVLCHVLISIPSTVTSKPTDLLTCGIASAYFLAVSLNIFCFIKLTLSV
jgi:hypothetical protein